MQRLSTMSSLLSIPYAVAGAWVGLLQGSCYAVYSLVEPLEPVLPAVAWITKPLELVLPELAVHHPHAEGQAAQPLDAGQAPPAAASSSSAAPAAPDLLVPEAATHSSALTASIHFSEPLVAAAAPQAAVPAQSAPADTVRDTAAGSMTAAAAAAAAVAAASAAAAVDDPHAPTAERLERLQRNFAECRVDSFPIDNLSPTNTTATAISSLLYTGGGLTPGGQTDYDPSAVAPLDEAVEGEMELTITHSTSNNLLWQPQQAAPAGATDTATVPASQETDAPAAGSAGAAGSRAADRSRQTDQTSPTKAARQQQHSKAATASFAGFAQPQQPGSSRSAYQVGKPAQRHQLQPRLSDCSTASSSCSSHGAAAAASAGGAASPVQPLQQQHKALSCLAGLGSSSGAAAAGGGKLTVSLPAAAAAADLDGPLSPSSLSSIHTTDSMGTVERKKKRGLFASLKQKALKGRQQVR